MAPLVDARARGGAGGGAAVAQGTAAVLGGADAAPEGVFRRFGRRRDQESDVWALGEVGRGDGGRECRCGAGVAKDWGKARHGLGVEYWEQGPNSCLRTRCATSADWVQVTDDLKLHIKAARLVGVHVSPTVVFNGIVENSISSGWTKEQWVEWLDKNVV